MLLSKKSLGIVPFMFFLLCFLLSLYFALAAVQGDYGMVKRNQIQSDMVLLDQELAQLKTKVSKLKNRTHRLSDDFLDFDLLDTQARFILGFIKPREIIIN